MRRVLLPAALMLVAAVALGACSSSAEPGWTYAPATPAASTSAAPSEGASGEPSGAPSEQPGDDGEAVVISAANIAFEQAEVESPADVAFTIRFENKDAGVPHNVEIKDANGQAVFNGEVFSGVETRDYSVPALAAGSYQFVCTVHPNMTGTLTAG